MLNDEQIAILCDIGQSIAFDDDKHGEVEKLIVQGYVMKDGDLYVLTAKGEKVVEVAAQRRMVLEQARQPSWLVGHEKPTVPNCSGHLS